MNLKPANVLLMGDGSARLADFNMAAELEGTHAYTPAFATPHYTPPELLWSEIGERGRRIRPSADIWAFGVLAHLFGHRRLPAARRHSGGPPRRGRRVRPRRGGAAPLPRTAGVLAGDRAAAAARTHEERILAVRHCCGGCGRRRARPGAPPAPPYGRSGRGGRHDGRGGGARPRRHRPHGEGAAGPGRAGTTAPARAACWDGADELRTDKGVPVAYRLIVDSAQPASGR
ncbi:Ser/Thr protein kinase OS=Streptomyces glaucescens OX=1907 GN=SGLAU_20715 PE=4 SV=1 [Streptomyces glaucescens]